MAVARARNLGKHQRLAQVGSDTEKLLSAALDSLPAHVAVLDDTGTIVAVNRAWRKFAEANGFVGNSLGVGSNYLAVCDATIGECAAEATHAGVGIRALLAGQLNAVWGEYPCHSPTEQRWFQCRAQRMADSEQVYVVLSHEEITPTRSAQEELGALTARLIAAQEDERRRIGRELHDDINQRLALLAVEMDRFAQKMPESADEEHTKLQGIIARAQALSSDVERLCYRLHPSKLEHVDLATALRGLCREFEQPNDLHIRFFESGSSTSTPFDVRLCLYRVTQEALRNVLKHGGVDEARVELTGGAQEIRLAVRDSGVGFNPEATKARSGIGLASMRERVQHVGGALSLQSEPGHGTCIEARIPLEKTASRMTL